MPRYKFAWTNLSSALLKGLVRDLALDGSDSAEALRAEYGARPTENFVRAARSVLEERWLAHDPAALAAVVKDLWRPSSRDGYRLPSTRRDQLNWLTGRNSTSRLLEVLLDHFIAAGERTATAEPPLPATRTAPRATLRPSRKGVKDGAGVRDSSGVTSSGQMTTTTPRQGGNSTSEARADNHAGFIWSVADLLRGDYKQSEYGTGHPSDDGAAPPRLRTGGDEGPSAGTG